MLSCFIIYVGRDIGVVSSVTLSVYLSVCVSVCTVSVSARSNENPHQNHATACIRPQQFCFGAEKVIRSNSQVIEHY